MAPATTLISTQGLAAQQAYRALMAVARLRLHELERGLQAASSVAQAAELRLEIRRTRTAISMGEKIG